MSKGMTRSGLALALVLTFSMAGLAASARAPGATARAQGQQQKPAYSYAEYNAYQAAAKEKNPEQRIKLLDDFVSKFPKSTLLPYIYKLYYETYNELQHPQYDKVIEYADKLIGSTDKAVTDPMKLQAILVREFAFNQMFTEKAADATQQAQTARQDAQLGLKLLNALAKPKGMSDEQFAQQKKNPTVLLHYTDGFCALFLKDYPGAEKAFKAALELDPKNAVTYFRLGVAYLQQAAKVAAAAPQAGSTPPASSPSTTTAPATAPTTAATGQSAAPLPGPSAGQELYIKGFWALARSIALNGSTKAEVQSYLQNQMLVYQKTACQDLLTQEMKQLLMIAQSNNTVDPPASYTLPSGVQLNAYLQNTNLFSIMQDLQGGGDRANFVWLAVCGNEFPEVPVKVISVSPTTDGVDMQVYTGSTPKDIQSAKTANMEVMVANQPAAKRLKKDDIVRFTGTLASFDPPPSFLLHWNNAKVNPADIPPAKPGARRAHVGRRHHR